jgi:hypothetical protein
MGADAAAIIVLRPEAFWDKQRVDNCTRTQKEGEVTADNSEQSGCDIPGTGA